MKIPFNKPHFTGREAHHVAFAASSGKISGNGQYTHKCHTFFTERYGFGKVLLTTSCTDALEMAAILSGVGKDDEVIMPTFTFVSTANAFELRGAKIVFADSETDTPNIDASKIETLITAKTKVIVAVHYAGMACNMDVIMDLANRYNLIVIEDAAQAIDSYYKDQPLGSIGHLATFSFHETKNITSGEGGMLVINKEDFKLRAEIIWEKGTNRAAFFRGEVDKYTWVDIGSSFLPSDLVAAFLYGQLEFIDDIQTKRKLLFQKYFDTLLPLSKAKKLQLPAIKEYATQNGHLFYIITNTVDERDELLETLKEAEIQAVFHYLPLHSSVYYKQHYEVPYLPMSDYYSKCMIRLPFYYDLQFEQIEFICDIISKYYSK